uniref:Uncharacterized protein n=1 Tax=Anguilla anguilla TaxID=7936 RepID=A0A0E9TES9_ANGAN
MCRYSYPFPPPHAFVHSYVYLWSAPLLWPVVNICLWCFNHKRMPTVPNAGIAPLCSLSVNAVDPELQL